MTALIITIYIAAFGFQVAANSSSRHPDSRAQENQVHPGAPELSNLETRAKGGDAAAQLELARAYLRGDGVPQDSQTAALWYRKAADQGLPEAENTLGQMYLTGDGVERNKGEAVKWYRKAARQGLPDAMYNLGTAYYNGDGVGVDDTLSYAWFTLAKEAGHQGAVEAVQRAESGLPASTINYGFEEIAEMYEQGKLLPENRVEAARWWLRAAENGDPDAQSAIGSRLVDGLGIPQDFAQGRHWCTEAAKQNNSRGEYCMGRIYQNGLGVRRDASAARKWYEQAATWNDMPSVKALAQMEANGEGGKKDPVSACLRYLNLVARTGDLDSLRSVARLKQGMNAKQWRQVETKLPGMHIDPVKVDDALQQVSTQQ